MESIEEEDETQVNATTTLNVPSVADRSPQNPKNFSQNPRSSFIYNEQHDI